jgi:hypothetical protein
LRAKSSCAFSPDGQVFAAGCESGDWGAVSLDNPAAVRGCQGHPGEAVRAQFSPDGRSIALGHHRSGVSVMRDSRCVQVTPEGHWRGEVYEDELVYVVETDQGQAVLSPAEFAKQHGWQNDPAKCRRPL